jgi:pyruvate,water dikinase
LLLNSQEIQRLILEMDLSPSFVEEVQSAFLRLDSRFVAVRSSATHEDSGSASWAGQLESFLNTTSQDLLLNIRKCWASLFSSRAMLYRAYCGRVADNISAAAIVQVMVDSRVSGTAFSAHPVTGDKKSVFIESCIGLGETLVLGKETPSSFSVSKETGMITDKEMCYQKTAIRRSQNGMGNESYVLSDVDVAMNRLTDAEAVEIAALVVSIEEDCGFPVDVEWAYGGDTLYLLQSRPITTI